MTLDNAIAALESLREVCGGDSKVGCWGKDEEGEFCQAVIIGFFEVAEETDG